MQFALPNETVTISPNITPDKSGIGNWSDEIFVDRFRMYADSGFLITESGQGDYQTVMPWPMDAFMREEDLKAIYAYLVSLKPVKYLRSLIEGHLEKHLFNCQPLIYYKLFKNNLPPPSTSWFRRFEIH